MRFYLKTVNHKKDRWKWTPYESSGKVSLAIGPLDDNDEWDHCLATQSPSKNSKLDNSYQHL